MESTGPTTRSRARGGAPSQTSAAPSTRRKQTTRSTRNSSVPLADPTPSKEAQVVQEATDGDPQADLIDTNTSDKEGVVEADVPTTVAAPTTAPIAGLTPVNATATPGYPMATPTTMVRPSPVMPIKLDSLWSPEAPQPSISTDFAAAGPRIADGRASDIGVDLAAMFISTPAPPTATNDAAVSPVEGLVSAEPSAAAVGPGSSSERFPEEPFGGFSEAAMAGSPAAADCEQRVESEQPAVEPELEQHAEGIDEQVSFGSPTAVAVEDASVTEMDDAEPSAPSMSLSHYPTPTASSPAPGADSSSTPNATAIRSTPGRTPGRAAVSPAPAGTPASPFPESDDDMPEAEAEYPDERAVLAEALAEGLALDTSGELQAKDGAEPAAVEEPAAGAEEEEYSEEDLLHDLPTTEDAEDLVEDTDIDSTPATAAAEQPTDEASAGAAQADEEFSTELAHKAEAGDGVEAAHAEEQDTAMEACDSPAADATQVQEEASLVQESVVQDTGAAMSPAVMSLAFDGAAIGARFTGSQATTAAPPKSAMALAKGEASAHQKTAGRKSAHVVLPDPSPVKSSYKTTAGRNSTSMPGPGSSSTNGNDTSSSPGHTPFPTKSKVRAATAAADRAAAAKEVSLKKEIAYARAHSALKHYNSSSSGKVEQQAYEEGDSAAAVPESAAKRSSSSSGGAGSKPVTSRLLQPTASSMAKSRTSLTSEIDTYVWAPPEAEPSAAAVGPSSKPRLASKVVVPSPVEKQKGEPSMKALKRAIKDKAEKKAKATLQEHQSSSDTHRVHDVHAMRSKKSSKPAKSADAAELEFDEEDYDESYDQDYHAVADELADSMTGLSMGPIRVHKPAGPLKGVAAPAGKHLVFDDAGVAKETPSSKLRAAPKHTYFDEEGNPRSAPPMPRWR